jgi:hypothetical protein
MQKFFRRIRKGIRDVGSGAKDVLRNNPEALMIGAAMFGLPALMGKMGGAGGGGGFTNFLSNILGQTSQTGAAGQSRSGSGLLGIGQNLLGGLTGGLTGGKGVEGNAGLLSLLASIIAKKAFEGEKEGPLSKKDRLSEIDLRYDDIVGGPQKASERFRGVHYDPTTDDYYDVKKYDATGDKYKDFEVDEEGIIIDPERRPSLGINEGGIVGLQGGGNPFLNRGTIKGSLGGGMNPTGWSPDPTIKSITGYRGGGIPYIDPNRGTLGGGMPGRQDPTIESIMGYDPRYVKRANGGMTAGDLADRLEDNPGISQFFPRKFGMIDGPGGPKEDKVPAMLSDGEFVMTAKAVDNAGGPKAMYNLMNRLDPDSSKGTGII